MAANAFAHFQLFYMKIIFCHNLIKRQSKKLNMFCVTQSQNGQVRTQRLTPEPKKEIYTKRRTNGRLEQVWGIPPTSRVSNVDNVPVHFVTYNKKP